MKEILRQHIEEAVRSLMEEGVFTSVELPKVEVGRAKDAQFGDYATNIAMILAKPLGKNPMEVAEALKEKLVFLCHSERILESGNLPDKNEEIPRQARDDNAGGLFEKMEVARPGYINFSLSQKALADVLGEAIGKGGHFGDLQTGKGKTVNNEFISANPTGPLHLGNGRGGFYGDALARVLRKAGYAVTNEYYVNDAGEQVLKLGHSVLKDDQAVYSGDYIDALHQQSTANNKQKTAREIGEEAASIVLEEMIKTTVAEKMGIAFDSFISEKVDIVEAGLVDRALRIFKEKGLSFENEGALWLKTTEFGDDKDRVLVKQDGTRTYFASDCGYILQKKERGFSRLILTLGADHHGYKSRILAAASALGFDGEFDFVFVQLVRLMKDGKEVRMSKRAGNVVSIDELLETVGHDVARFFFLMYSPDTHMNFDLGLAAERSAKNPVYYVQYAHARLASILRKAAEADISAESADFSLLSAPKERELLREIAFFPELIEEVTETYAVHRLPQYAMRLSDRLHSFYDECRVIDPERPELSKARVALVSGVKAVLKETLSLLGIDAPERMVQESSNSEQGAVSGERKTGNE